MSHLQKTPASSRLRPAFGGRSAAFQSGLRATALASSWWISPPIDLCQGIRTGPLRNHPRGRKCYLRSPVLADRLEPVAQPPPAGCSCVYPTRQGTSRDPLANRTPPGKQCLTAAIFRPPRQTPVSFVRIVRARTIRALHRESPQSQQPGVSPACRRPKSRRSRGDGRRSAADAELRIGRVSSLIRSWVVVLHSTRLAARGWNGHVGTHDPRSGRGQALQRGSPIATVFRPHPSCDVRGIWLYGTGRAD